MSNASASSAWRCGMTDEIRGQLGRAALADLEDALGRLRRLTAGLHLPGVGDALDDAWRALGAVEASLPGEPEPPPAPGG